MKSAVNAIVYFIFGISVFIGLPVVSFGLSRIQEYLSDPVRLLYTLSMSLATLCVVLFVPNQGRGYGAGEKIVRRQNIAILFFQITSLLDVTLSPFSDAHLLFVLPDSIVLRSCGLALTLVGYFFMSWSVVALGRQFSVKVTIQAGHELVTGGLYTIIRHPRYLGILLFLLGVAVVFRSFIGVTLALLTLVIVIWRINDEEALMKAEFADKWEAYIANSWRLIPFLY